MSTDYSKKTVAVIGTGYVGLPMCLMLARAGWKVVGVDINPAVVEGIKSGKLHIREPVLQELFDKPEVRKNFTAQTSPPEADIFVIAVPTPLTHGATTADLTLVEKATQSIVPVLRKGNLVVLESTVSPRCCRDVMTPILEKTGLKANVDFYISHCPERILPGEGMLKEIENNDRIIGAATETAQKLSIELYRSFVKGELLVTDDITAELTKLMENTFRDVNIALANSLRAVAETVGADPETAIKYANHHPRVNILQPGIGVGGHCIPIDPWFLYHADPANAQLVLAARQYNDSMPLVTAKKIVSALEAKEKKSKYRIIVLGAAYKPDVDDIRESPALHVVEHLRSLGVEVTHLDPHVESMSYSSLAEASKGHDALFVIIRHQLALKELKEKKAEIEAALALGLTMVF